MSNLIDNDPGTDRFVSYEGELKLVQADLNQQLEEIKESTGEPRKAAVSKAKRALEEADELVSRCLEPLLRRGVPEVSESHIDGATRGLAHRVHG